MKIIAQIFGAIALILIFFSYQKNKKKDFLYLQVFANIFYGLQYLCLNAISAFASSIISIVKTLVFYNHEKIIKKFLYLY